MAELREDDLPGLQGHGQDVSVTARRIGPSPEAIERLDAVLLCLVDAGVPLRVRPIIDRLSEPMSRADCDSALKRLRGSRMVEVAEPGSYQATAFGRTVAQKRIMDGKGY